METACRNDSTLPVEEILAKMPQGTLIRADDVGMNTTETDVAGANETDSSDDFVDAEATIIVAACQISDCKAYQVSHNEGDEFVGCAVITYCEECDKEVCDAHIVQMQAYHPFPPRMVCNQCCGKIVEAAVRADAARLARNALPDRTVFSDMNTRGLGKFPIELGEYERLKIRSDVYSAYRRILDAIGSFVVFDHKCGIAGCNAVLVNGEFDASLNEHINCKHMTACEDCGVYYCDMHSLALTLRTDMDPNDLVLCDPCYESRKRHITAGNANDLVVVVSGNITEQWKNVIQQYKLDVQVTENGAEK